MTRISLINYVIMLILDVRRVETDSSNQLKSFLEYLQ